MRMIMLITALFMYAAIQAQDVPASQVPAAVKNTLKAKFPKTTGLDWEMKGDLYEADFDVNNIDHKALLDAAGKLVAVKYDIRTTALPAAIKTALKGKKIDGVEKVEKNGTIFYQVELDSKPHDEHLVFSADGKIDTSQQYW
jgi:hypothetical protein